jgi:hypothetical protein
MISPGIWRVGERLIGWMGMVVEGRSMSGSGGNMAGCFFYY